MSVAGRRVAVIGASGFVGSHLTERLVALGADTLAVVRTTTRLSSIAAVRGECTVAVADICDPAAIHTALARFRPDVVIHLAAQPDAPESFGHIADVLRGNMLGLLNVLQAAAAAQTDVFVYGDSTKDYGDPKVPYRRSLADRPICSYAIAKSAGWQLCQLVSRFTSMKTVGIRPTFVYGPRQGKNVISYVQQCVMTRQPIRLMGGEQTRDPLYVSDVVEAFIAAAVRPEAWGYAIPIGGGTEISVQALCELAREVFGGDVPILSGAEAPRLTEIWRSHCDNHDAEDLLGWRPRVPLDEGLERLVQFAERPPSGAPHAVATRPRLGCYLWASVPGVVYRMLDRREGRDRRFGVRGGRRMEDARILAAFGGASQRASRQPDLPTFRGGRS